DGACPYATLHEFGATELGVGTGSGDDLLRISSPSISSLERVWYELKQGSDVLIARVRQRANVNRVDFHYVEAGPGDALVDVRDLETNQVDCGPGEDTAYVDPPGTGRLGDDVVIDCEHVVVGDSGARRLDVGVRMHSGRWTSEAAPAITALELHAD